MPDSRIMHKVRAAARRIGRSEASLRRWDEAGLFAVRRDRHGARVYTESDISELLALKEAIRPGPKAKKAPAAPAPKRKRRPAAERGRGEVTAA